MKFREYMKANEDPKIKLALEEVLAVCKRHGISISHEAGQDGFIIEDWDEDNARWLMDAEVERISELKPAKKQTVCKHCNEPIRRAKLYGWEHIDRTPKHKAVPATTPKRSGNGKAT